MSSVDIGLRLLLQDNASAGLSGFQNIVRSLISTVSGGIGQFTDFSGQIAKQQEAAQLAQASIAGYAAQMEMVAAKSAAADEAVTAMNKSLADQGILTEVEDVQLAQQTIADLRVELGASTGALNYWQDILDKSGGTDAQAAAQVANYQSKVAQLEAQIDTANASMAVYDENVLRQASAYTNAQNSAQGYQDKLNSLGQDIQNSQADYQNAQQAINDLGAAQDATNLKTRNLTVGVGLLAGGAVGLGLLDAATKAIIKDSGNLDDAMSAMKIAFNLTGDQANEMGQKITQVAANSRFSVTEVADGFTALGEQGRTFSDIMNNNVGQSAINFAEAVKSDTVPAAQLLSETMTTFGAKADEASKYADMLTYAFYNGIPNVTQLQTAIQDVGGMANESGVKFNELVVVLDMLHRSGMNASTAATSLRYILTTLTDPTDKTAKALTDLGVVTINQTSPAFQQFTSQLDAAAGISKKTANSFDGTLTSLEAMFKQSQGLGVPMTQTDKSFMQWATSLHLLNSKLYDSKGNMKGLFDNIRTLGNAIDKLPDAHQKAEAIQQLFNTRSGQDANILLTNITKTNGGLNSGQANLQNFINNNGAAKDAQARTNTLPGDFAKFQTTLSSFIAQAGMPFVEWLKSALNWMNGLVKGWNGMNPEVRRGVSAFLLLLAVLSPIAIIAGIVVVAMALMTPAMLAAAGTVGLIVAAVIGLAVVGALIYAKWGAISSFFVGLWRTVSGAVVSGVTTAVNAIKSWIGQAGAWFQSFGHTILSGIQIGFNAAYTFVVSWGTKIKNAVVNGFNSSVAAVKNFGASILNGAKSAFNAVFNFIGGLGANFHKAMGWMYNHNYYWQAMVDGAHVNLNKLNKFIGDFSTAAQKDWNNFWTSAHQTVTSKWKDISTGVQNGWNGTSKWWNDGMNSQKAYWGKHWGELQSESSSAMNGINRGIQSGWNWAMGYINVGVNAARGLFNYLFGWVPGAASSAFHSAASGISSGMDVAKNAVNGGIQYINNMVGGWGASMQQFGNNAVKMLANGIMSGIGWVQNAVSSVGQTIWKDLGFHSPPKGGILSDSDQYMPNMMKMYGTGIRDNMHHVKNAVGDVASTIHKGFTTPMTQAIGTAYAGMSSANSANNPNTTINLQMDSKVVGQVVIDRVTGQLVMNGLNRRMR